MKHFYFLSRVGSLAAALGATLLLLPSAAQAQAPAWTLALAGSIWSSSVSSLADVAADASGNLFVTGSFAGTLTLGQPP
jgi:hypothetical protein